jgi:serine/threonine protein kinase
MGNLLCPNHLNPVIEENHKDLTERLRRRMKMISFKQAKKASADALVSKLEIVREYKVACQIGKGLFSHVFLAVDGAGRKVALKVILKNKFKTKEAIEKIIVEKEVLRMVSHKNVLKLYRTMQTNSHIYFVLELADKGNLLSIVNAKRLKPAEIRVILAQVIEALFYLHSQGIIYGDLKAENILTNSSGIVKLCDFNLAGTSNLLGDSLQGTPSYIAPEILEGCDRTPKSDFWSLGVLTYLLTYHKMPFRSSTHAQLMFDILDKEIDNESDGHTAPQALKQLIKDLLVKSYRKRIGSDINDFINHPFFEGFDWKRYHSDPKNFTYIDGIKSLDMQGDQAMKYDSELDPLTLLPPQNQKFVYDIDDFTYQTNDISESHEFSSSQEPESRGSESKDRVRSSTLSMFK